MLLRKPGRPRSRPHGSVGSAAGPAKGARFLPRSLSLRARVSHAQTLARRSDSLVRVSRRVVERHFASILGAQVAAAGSTAAGGTASARLLPHRAPARRPARPAPMAGGARRIRFLGRRQELSPGPVRPAAETAGTLPQAASPGPGNRCWPALRGHRVQRCTPRHSPPPPKQQQARHGVPRLIRPPARTDTHRFPVGNFTYCLTLSSECFSTFPHGTCSLSVSRLYLALDGIYHPFWAAFPNNPTRRAQAHRMAGRLSRATDGIVTLHDAPFQGTWTRAAAEHWLIK